MNNIFDNMTDDELIAYAQSIEADAYLSSIEAHEDSFIDSNL